jgi:hypothetical protein
MDEFLIAASCSPNDRYIEATNTCEPCPTGMKSFGFQQQECYSCLQMRWNAIGSEVSVALYGQVCTDGQLKSMLLMIAVPAMILLLGLICCVTTDQKEDDDDDISIKSQSSRGRVHRGYTRNTTKSAISRKLKEDAEKKKREEEERLR